MPGEPEIVTRRLLLTSAGLHNAGIAAALLDLAGAPVFPSYRRPLMEKLAAEAGEPIYAIDDDAALRVVDGRVDVVGEGESLLVG